LGIVEPALDGAGLRSSQENFGDGNDTLKQWQAM
jgi:hypothetical protein